MGGRRHCPRDLRRTIGGRVRRVRERLDWTQEMLCRVSGLSRSMVGGIENGRYAPGVEALCVLARVLDVTPDWLLGWGEPS